MKVAVLIHTPDQSFALKRVNLKMMAALTLLFPKCHKDLRKTQEVVEDVLTSVPGGRHCAETCASQLACTGWVTWKSPPAQAETVH